MGIYLNNKLSVQSTIIKTKVLKIRRENVDKMNWFNNLKNCMVKWGS